MTIAVAGLDPSTSRIGWASPTGHTSSLSARAGAADPARRLHELAREVERVVRLYPPRPDLVALEGYSLGSPGRIALIRLGEIGGVIRCRLHELAIAYVEIPPSSLKRHATGNGAADKERMLARARELCPEGISNHDEADAWLLRRMTRQALGIESIEHGHEADAIAALTWPNL